MFKHLPSLELHQVPSESHTTQPVAEEAGQPWKPEQTQPRKRLQTVSNKERCEGTYRNKHSSVPLWHHLFWKLWLISHSREQDSVQHRATVCGLHCRHSWGHGKCESDRDNGHDWHKDCNKTQHRWHSTCFRPKRRGQPAAHKSLLKRCLSEAAAPRLR